MLFWGYSCILSLFPPLWKCIFLHLFCQQFYTLTPPTLFRLHSSLFYTFEPNMFSLQSTKRSVPVIRHWAKGVADETYGTLGEISVFRLTRPSQVDHLCLWGLRNSTCWQNGSHSPWRVKPLRDIHLVEISWLCGNNEASRERLNRSLRRIRTPDGRNKDKLGSPERLQKHLPPVGQHIRRGRICLKLAVAREQANLRWNTFRITLITIIEVFEKVVQIMLLGSIIHDETHPHIYNRRLSPINGYLSEIFGNRVIGKQCPASEVSGQT